MGKVMVTGATGFTGKALCRRLVQEGEQVVALVRSGSKVEDLKELGVECRVADLKDRHSVLNGFAGIKKVFHLAAAYRTEHADRGEFRLVNVEGTRNVLDAAGAAGVNRFVHCSTVGVQGHIASPPADEEYRFNPGDHYQASKLEGELLARRYFSDGLPGVVVRPTGIYGPGDSRFLKLFRSVQNGYFIMIGSGRTLYHMTYIDDLVNGILLASQKQEALGKVFTIGGEEYTTIRALVDAIADTVGTKRPRLRVPFYPVYLSALLLEGICRPLGIVPPLYPRRTEFFHHDRAFKIDRAKTLLGYRPRVGLREGLKRSATWYRENGLL